MKMKYVVALVLSAVLLFSFGDKGQNTFSQEIKKTPEAVKAKIASDSAVVASKLSVAYDSLKKETEKTKVIVAETEAIIEQSKQLTQDLLINKDKHIAVKKLADQTLKVAVYKSQKIPMNFVIAPRKKEAVLPVELKAKALDTLIIPIPKRTFFDKIFFRKRKE